MAGLEAGAIAGVVARGVFCVSARAWPAWSSLRRLSMEMPVSCVRADAGKARLAPRAIVQKNARMQACPRYPGSGLLKDGIAGSWGKDRTERHPCAISRTDDMGVMRRLMEELLLVFSRTAPGISVL